jgi:dephospho-CoA kinase
MMVLGLTGSIGTGKTTTAGFFAELGIPVHDADAVVHELYRGEAVDAIENAFPGVAPAGVVDREKLGAAVLGIPDAMRKLEAIVHPLVRRKEREFLEACRRRGDDIVVLDIPLLLETGGRDRVDAVVVTVCDEAEQRRRVLARPGMTAEKFERLRRRQMLDADKRRLADFIIDTGLGMESARRQVGELVGLLRSGRWCRPAAD